MKHRKKTYKIKFKKQQKILVIGLFGLLLFISFGYGTFSTNINLSTKGNISSTPEECFTVEDNGNGTGTITNYDANTCGTKVKIPEKINNLTINKIISETDNGAFSYKNITKIIFPETLEELGKNCCRGLNTNNVIIPKNVKIIGYRAFQDGTLHSIILNEGLETIGWGAFENNFLTTLKIPHTVKNLNHTIAVFNSIEGDDAFIYARDENGNEDKKTLISFGNSNTKEVIIPDGVQIIKDYSIMSYYLEKLTFPDSVKEIYGDAIYGTKSLKQINIGSGIKTIDSVAFRNSSVSVININRKENAIDGAPWGSANATINWTGIN